MCFTREVAGHPTTTTTPEFKGQQASEKNKGVTTLGVSGVPSGPDQMPSCTLTDLAAFERLSWQGQNQLLSAVGMGHPLSPEEKFKAALQRKKQV